MRKSLIAAAALAAVTVGVAGTAEAAVVGTGVGGVSAHSGSQLVEHVYWRRHHHRHWVCTWHHHHKRCWWRYY